MALEIRITVGADTFEVKGDLTLDAAFSATFRQWLNATQATAGQLEDLAAQLEQQSAALDAAVTAHTLPGD